MKVKSMVLFCLIGSFIFACGIPSLYPLYSEDSLVFKKELLGIWLDQNEPSQWHFEAVGDHHYKLTHTSDSLKAEFKAYLVQLEDHYFLDLYPAELAGGLNEMMAMHLIPVHTFSKVVFEDGQVSLHFFDIDWLEKLSNNKQLLIKHETTDDYILLTAATPELQKFVLKYADSKEAFIDPIKLLAPN